LALLLSGCEFDGDSWGASDRHKEDFHMSYPLGPGGRVALESFNGSVEVTAWDQNTVDVSGTKYAATPEQLAQIKVEADATPGAVRIRTVRPTDRWRMRGGVKYIIRVPRKVELERIESSNGGLRVEGTEGAARLKTSNGRVTVSALRGTLVASSSNGGVELRDVVGDADLSTSNGGIDVTAHKGAVSAQTSNGGVHLALADVPAGKAVRADTSNGNVEISLPALNDNDVRVESSNGGITLRLPDNVKARVSARTSNAKIRSDFDVATTFRGEIKNRLEGTINGGGALLDLHTSNGGIRLERR